MMLTRGLVQRRLRQVHFWLGAVIGAQVLLWIGSGLFMVLFDIEEVRGNHLRAPVADAPLILMGDTIPPEAALSLAPFPAYEAELKVIRGKTVWLISGEDDRLLIDAVREEVMPLPNAQRIAEVAAERYSGRGTVQQTEYLETGPQEVGSNAPVWAVTFGPKDKATLYLDPVTAELQKVRTPLWRAFDFAWGLHIMDWTTRENFNSWWIKATAVFSFIFACAGGLLVATRLTRR
ncbi:MAG: PepSY domain-containing protein [Pseudomonadota bacterium]